MIKNTMTSSSYNTLNMTSLKKIPKNYMINSNTTYKNNSTLSLGNNTNNNFNLNNLYNNTGTELSNPLINQQETIQENDTYTTNINNNSSLMKTGKSNNMSYIYSGSKYINNNRSQLSETGFIKLNKNLSTTSLKNEIENLKDLNDKINFNFYPKNKKTHFINIFNSNFKEFYKNKNQKNNFKINNNNIIGKNLNELNKKIIMDGGWGNHTLNKNNSTGNLLYSKHLTKYQALRELGSNLLTGIKVKLPRDRKVDVHI